MIAQGRAVEVVLRTPLARDTDKTAYAIAGAFGGFSRQLSGEAFLTLYGPDSDEILIPVAMIGVILANGRSAA